jgi:DNA-binding response OmpR family regulator
MSTESSRPTPLGVARARFVEGLPRKAQELKGSVALLAGTPNEEKPREELRRRLHALYASAQVFQLEKLAVALKEGIARLDVARDQKRGLADDDLDVLALLAATLPVLGGETPAHDPEDVAVPRPPALPSVGGPPKRETLPQIHVAPPPSPSVRPRAVGEGGRVPSKAPTLTGLTPVSAELREGLASSIEARATIAQAPRAAVVSVLVCDGAETQAKVRALLAGERFEVLGAADPEEALRLARSSAPDVVLVDKATIARAGSDFVRRLREDPLTDFVPVVVLFAEGEELDAVAARELGADDVLGRPLTAEVLERAVVRLAAVGSGAQGSRLTGDHTVEELASRIAEEIRRGLVDSLDRGRDLSVPIGDGTEVLAATWSAIGRLRAHLATRSGGRVHFREREGALATLALVDEEPAGEGTSDISLRDRRVIIADDDPAVVWFFASLLREAGAIATETHDGEEALREARRSRPDVVIADILMPKLDGFSLTRELKRDPVLADVPVVLLSWKEDFLQRMRELQSGASGYLKKEAGAAQILAAVREVLRPRARLEQRLRAGGDVRGRLERIGVIPLLHTTASQRPDARITVRDAWNLFEIDLRKGALVDITRTASDGSFTRGPRVVVALLGATEGRFTVADSDAPVRASVREPLDLLVQRSAAELGGLVDAVSGRGLVLAQRVEFDDDVLASILRAAPPTVAAAVDALKRGRGPRSLIVDGTYAPQDLERVLVDLARQGAITSVLGEANEDRVAAARRERGETELPVRMPSLMPPPRAPEPVEPSLTPSAAGLDLSWIKSEEETADIVRETYRMASEPPPKAAAEPARAPAPRPPPRRVDDDDEPVLELSGGNTSETHAADTFKSPPPKVTEPLLTKPITVRSSPLPPPPLPDEADDEDEDEEADAPPPKPALQPPPKAATKPATATKPPAAKPAAEPQGLGIFAWTFILVALAAVGFAGWRLTHPSQDPRPTTPTTPVAHSDEASPTTPQPPDPDVSPETTSPDSVTPEVTADDPPTSFSGYGREEEGIDPAFEVAVAEGQGLLVLEPGTEPMTVRIGELSRRLGTEPVAIALPEGVHDLSFVRADATSFRFAHVTAGRTRYAPPP